MTLVYALLVALHVSLCAVLIILCVNRLKDFGPESCPIHRAAYSSLGGAAVLWLIAPIAWGWNVDIMGLLMLCVVSGVVGSEMLGDADMTADFDYDFAEFAESAGTNDNL